jgi:hypothetical protein
MRPGRHLLLLVLLGWSGLSLAQHDSVANTVHNLSVSGPGEIRAATETEVCKFCHIPHNAVVPVPLWSRPLSESDYVMPAPSPDDPASANQPLGASRLCLSCHDGTLALGKLGNEAGNIAMLGSGRLEEAGNIAMLGSGRLEAGHRGFLGTDLSGSHPISVEIRDRDVEAAADDSDMGLKPVVSIMADKSVRLDNRGMIQCTTCHDPHSDRYYEEGVVPRFWVEPTVAGVCLKCHELR